MKELTACYDSQKLYGFQLKLKYNQPGYSQFDGQVFGTMGTGTCVTQVFADDDPLYSFILESSSEDYISRLKFKRKKNSFETIWGLSGPLSNYNVMISFSYLQSMTTTTVTASVSRQASSTFLNAFAALD